MKYYEKRFLPTHCRFKPLTTIVRLQVPATD